LFDGAYEPETVTELHPSTHAEMVVTYWVRKNQKPLYICRDVKKGSDSSWVITESLNLRHVDTVILAESVGCGSPADVAWPQGMVVSRHKPVAATTWWDRLCGLFLGDQCVAQSRPCVHCGLLNTDVRRPVWVSLASPYMQYSGQYSPCDNFAWGRDFQDDDNLTNPMLASLKLVCDRKTWTWWLATKEKKLMCSQAGAKHPADAAWLEPGIVVSRRPFWF
jgi:hypothetical protein